MQDAEHQLTIAVHGATGRMGRELVGLIVQDPDLRLTGAITRPGSPALDRSPSRGTPPYVDLEHWGGEARVMIDFSHPDALPALTRACRQRQVALVSGTTGRSPDAEAALDELAREQPVLVAANFSPGLQATREALTRLATRLPPDYRCALVEAHHAAKRDAPSGTALDLARSLARDRGCPQEAVDVHALRLGDLVGQHEVWFVGEGETVILRHEVRSRAIFARGALLAARWLARATPGRHDFARVLGGPPGS
jgi:4-hydroxy-tetrahydrodipicolinate reductase